MRQIESPTGQDVATFLGRQDDLVFVNQCAQTVQLVRDWAENYTRGAGFSDDNTLPADLAGAILSRAARVAANPLSYIAEGADTVSSSDRWAGDWNPGELRVLNFYRQKTK